jgi:cobaltochelatase CobN
MSDLGLRFAGRGCGCEHPDRGGALAPPRALKSTARRLHKASDLAGRVRLAFTECLGPCSEANVVLLYVRGQPLWFRRMNAPELLEALLGYARAIADGDAPALPPALASRSFAGAGRGHGPAPPVADTDGGDADMDDGAGAA